MIIMLTNIAYFKSQINDSNHYVTETSDSDIQTQLHPAITLRALVMLQKHQIQTFKLNYILP